MSLRFPESPLNYTHLLSKKNAFDPREALCGRRRVSQSSSYGNNPWGSVVHPPWRSYVAASGTEDYADCEMLGTAKLYKYHTTNLGYTQLQNVGSFYRDRYVKKDSAHQILGISPDQYQESQLWVTAPDQTVSHPFFSELIAAIILSLGLDSPGVRI